jgi:RNA polymerase sigma-70 factor, ECF subfamily
MNPLSEEVSPEAFEAEAMPHLGDLYRTAARVVRDRGAAEDLVQEVYLQAWKSFGKYEPGTNCRAWLYKILFNKIDHHRRRQASRARRLADDESPIEFAAAPPATPPAELTDAQILAALDRLPARYREVVLLADVQEFSYREIADILRVPAGTVMSRLSRGRAQLRLQLGALARDYGIAAAADEALAGGEALAAAV